MGFLYGKGIESGINNLVNMYDTSFNQKLAREKFEQEKLKFEQEKILQAAQMERYKALAEDEKAQALARRQEAERLANFQKEYQGLLAPRETYGVPAETAVGGDTMADLDMNPPRMAPGRPTFEQRMDVYRKYATPKEAMMADISISNVDEKLKTSEKLSADRQAMLEKVTLLKIESEFGKLRERAQHNMDLFRVTDDARYQRDAQKQQHEMALLKEKFDRIMDAIKLKAEVKPPADNTYKDQIAYRRAQTMAETEMKNMWTKDPLTNIWKSSKGRVPQEEVDRTFKKLVEKHYNAISGGSGAGGGGTADPLGIR